MPRWWQHLHRPPAATDDPQPGVPFCWPLDEPFLRLGRHDVLTTRDMFEGVMVLGNPGSGKSSTTGTAIPLAALRAGWGVIAYTTKPDDAVMWADLCRRTNRTPVFLRPDGGTHFNLIQYELHRPTPGGGNTVALAATLAEIIREGKPAAAASEAGEFFAQSSQIAICNAIDLLRFAAEPVSFQSIQRVLNTAPTHPAELEADHWQNGYCCRTLNLAAERTAGTADQPLCDSVAAYFLDRLPTMNERTRGDVFATIDAAFFQLTREPIRSMIDSPHGCSFFPESLEDGAVFIVDCPTSVYGSVGRMLSIFVKRLAKDVCRRRHICGDATRPILQFCDEAQSIVTRDDRDFLQIARSNRVSTVMLTQSFDNFVAALGTEAQANSLANALTTLIVHATSGRTAQWVEQRIAADWQPTTSFNLQTRSGQQDQGTHPGMSVSEGLHAQVLASELTRLRTGGPLNAGHVDAVVFKPGRMFTGSGLPFLRITFCQE